MLSGNSCFLQILVQAQIGGKGLRSFLCLKWKKKTEELKILPNRHGNPWANGFRPVVELTFSWLSCFTLLFQKTSTCHALAEVTINHMRLAGPFQCYSCINKTSNSYFLLKSCSVVQEFPCMMQSYRGTWSTQATMAIRAKNWLSGFLWGRRQTDELFVRETTRQLNYWLKHTDQTKQLGI